MLGLEQLASLVAGMLECKMMENLVLGDWVRLIPRDWHYLLRIRNFRRACLVSVLKRML